MALVLKDRVKETTTTAGTGTVTLAGATAGFQSFAAVGNGNQTFYAIVDSATGDWEVGVGTYTASGTTLSRTTVVSSSNAGSLVSFGSGSKDVFVTYPSSRSVYLDAAGSAVTTLDIGTLGVSTANISTANITAGTVANAPVNNTDIVNKQYADAIASGIHFHEAVNLATTAALPANTYNNGTSGVGATLTGNANGALSVDSTLTTASERILVKNEVTQANNGVYTVTQVGSAGTPYILTRATDFDSVGTGVNEIDEGDFFLVTSGTANVNTAWVQQTPPPITIGTTALVFQQFSAPITYTAGTGLNESPTYTFNIANTTVTAATYGSASAVPVFAVNAQGQLTSVTNTAIAINGSAVTGAISGQAGSVANALTLGTYLTGGSFNGSAAVTATVDATSANTASKVVARDASGDFSAGTITATLSGSSTSATTATNLAGGTLYQIPYQTAAGTTSFITAASGTNTVLNFNGSAFSWSAGTISGVPLGSNLNSLTAGTYLTGTAYNGSAALTWTVDATSANTASKVVARDASGNFSAGTITAALTGNATTTSQTNFSNLTIGGSQVLYAGNYNSYAPTLTGTGASGTWGIRVTGFANAGTPRLYASDSPYNYDGASPYYMAMTYDGSRWLLQVTPGTPAAVRVAYADASGSAGSVDFANLTNKASGTGTYTTSGDYRAPIFYDSDNTSYYADFAGSTSLSLNGGISFATANPYLSAPSYLVIPGGAYFNSGTVYIAANLQARGGVGNDSGAALTLTGGTSGYTQINGSARSPIFYDSDNTGYYVDPAGTSNLGIMVLSGAGYFRPNNWIQLDGYYGLYSANNSAHFYPNNASTYTQWAMQGVKNSYSGIYDSASGVNLGMYDGGGNGGVYREANGRWIFYHLISSDCTGFGTSTTNAAYNIYCPKGIYSGGRVDGTIFYDANDTGYSLDPTSISSLRTVGSWRADSATWDGEFSGKIQYHSNNWYFQYAGSMLFRNSSGSNVFTVDQSGNAVASGNVTAYSDARIKENVVTIDAALDKVLRLRGVYYNKIGNPERRVGVIAQETEPVLPEVVRSVSDTNPSTGETTELLAVDYGNITGLLIEATKEQNQEVVDLRNRVAQLESLINKLIGD